MTRIEEIREAFEATPEPERNPEDVAIGELLAALDERDASIVRHREDFSVACRKINRAREVVEAARHVVVEMPGGGYMRRLEGAIKRYDEGEK